MFCHIWDSSQRVMWVKTGATVPIQVIGDKCERFPILSALVQRLVEVAHMVYSPKANMCLKQTRSRFLILSKMQKLAVIGRLYRYIFEVTGHVSSRANCRNQWLGTIAAMKYRKAAHQYQRADN